MPCSLNPTNSDDTAAADDDDNDDNITNNCRGAVLPEKLIGHHLVKKFPTILTTTNIKS